MYSWRTCNYYRYYMWEANCRIRSVNFLNGIWSCPQTNGGGFTCACPTAAYRNDIRDFLNDRLDWYSEPYSVAHYKWYCKDRQL